jgi:hypothetical protein
MKKPFIALIAIFACTFSYAQNDQSSSGYSIETVGKVSSMYKYIELSKQVINEEMIANGKANEIVFVAIDLPTSLTVKSVATTTNGKLKAAQVNLIPKISIGIDTRKLDIVIITM